MRYCLVFALLAGLAVGAAENLLVAPKVDFGTGYPRGWRPAGAPWEVVKGENGNANMKALMKEKGKQGLWMNRVPVKNNVSYEFRVRARGTEGTQFSLFAEHSAPWETISKRFTVTAKWQEYVLPFRFKKIGKETPYVAFEIKTKGEVEVAPVSVMAVAAPAAKAARTSLLEEWKLGSSGFPGGWTPQKNAPWAIGKREDGAPTLKLSFKSDGKKGLWMVHPDLKPGVFYELRAKVRGTAGTSFSFFAEHNQPWETVSKRFNATAKWQEYIFSFRFQKPFKGSRYIGFEIRTEGELEMFPVFLREVPENFIVNCEFEPSKVKNSLPGWFPSKGTKVQSLRLPDGGFAMEVKSTEPECHVMQGNLKLVPGKEYLLRVRYKGEKGINARIFVECTKPGHTCGKRFPCNGSWQTVEIPVRFEKLERSPYLCLGYAGKGTGIVFADPQLIAKDSAPQKR